MSSFPSTWPGRRARRRLVSSSTPRTPALPTTARRNRALFATLAALFLASWIPAAPSSAGEQLTIPAQPLAFEANRGQTDHHAAFLARGQGYMLHLLPTEAVLSLKGRSAAAPRPLRLRLLGAAPHAQTEGEAPLPGRHNYYIGNDPRRWHTGIPTYAKVRSKGVYPGIDLVYYGKEGRLEYDLLLAAGADPHAVRLAFDGADKMTLNRQGDLVLQLGKERLIQHAPYAYQTVGNRQIPVAAHYLLRGRSVSFELGAYDRTRPLVIDPTLIYASYLGGSSDDEARAVAVDSAGNIYITGQTASTDLPGKGSSTHYSGGINAISDAFVTKLDSAGNVLFSTYLGSDGSIEPEAPGAQGLQVYEQGEKGNAIAVDNQGRIYITGGTAANATSNQFPTTNGTNGSLTPYQTCGSTSNRVFVSILNSDGSLHYSTCVGNDPAQEGLGLAVDGSGDVYVVGYTTASNFPTTSGALQTAKSTAPSLRDSFFFKLDPSTGSSGLLYSTYLGSTQPACCDTYATAVAVDGNGNAYVTGWTGAQHLPAGFPTANAYQSTLRGTANAFVYKINPTGGGASDLLYASYLGGSSIDNARSIAVDGSGNIWVAGQTSSADFPHPNGPYTNRNGASDGFVAKINPSLSGTGSLVYGTYLGGNGDDAINAIAVDSGGRANVTGWTKGGFPVTDHARGYDGGLDAFAAILDTASGLVYSTYLGGSGDDQGRGIAVAQDGSGKFYVAGGTASTDFPVTADAAQPSNRQTYGASDAFVAVLGTVADMGIAGIGVSPTIPKELQSLTYTVTAKNYGPDPATGAKLMLDLNVTLCSTCSPMDSASLAYDNNRCTVDTSITNHWLFTCNLGNMAAGDTQQLSFGSLLTTAQTVTATATGSADQTDTNSNDDSATAYVTADTTFVPPTISVPSTPAASGGGGLGGGGPFDPALLLAFAAIALVRATPRA